MFTSLFSKIDKLLKKREDKISRKINTIYTFNLNFGVLLIEVQMKHSFLIDQHEIDYIFL